MVVHPSHATPSRWPLLFVCRRIALVRSTLYGAMWVTKIVPGGLDSAYQSVELPVHTDGNYFTDPCGIQVRYFQ